MMAYERQLRETLNADTASILRNTRERVRAMIAACHGVIVLFGAGELGCETLSRLRKAAVEPVAFADNNPALWGKEVLGIPVLSPEGAVAQFGVEAVFVITIYTSGPPRKQLIGLGVIPISFAELGWAYPSLLPYADVHLPNVIGDNASDILAAARLWSDEHSRAEYLGQLKWRTTLDPNVLPDHLRRADIYYPSDLVDFEPDEVMVDCGAYDGDSISEFIRRTGGKFGGIVAIEPDPSNCGRLMSCLSTLPENQKARTTVLNCAVGARKERLRFHATGTAGSSLGRGDSTIESRSLDELLAGMHPSYIKMDIEGWEIDALSGAEQIIREHTPVLAVCLYHRPEDLWRVPLTIQSISNVYRYFIRRYCDEGWEIVCYAVPRTRSRK